MSKEKKYWVGDFVKHPDHQDILIVIETADRDSDIKVRAWFGDEEFTVKGDDLVPPDADQMVRIRDYYKQIIDAQPSLKKVWDNSRA